MADKCVHELTIEYLTEQGTNFREAQTKLREAREKHIGFLFDDFFTKDETFEAYKPINRRTIFRVGRPEDRVFKGISPWYGSEPDEGIFNSLRQDLEFGYRKIWDGSDVLLFGCKRFEDWDKPISTISSHPHHEKKTKNRRATFAFARVDGEVKLYSIAYGDSVYEGCLRYHVRFSEITREQLCDPNSIVFNELYASLFDITQAAIECSKECEQEAIAEAAEVETYGEVFRDLQAQAAKTESARK